MESDRFCDYQEFMRRELRQYFGAITVWNRGKGGEEVTKSLLKKNKKRLRSGGMRGNGEGMESMTAIESLAEKHEKRKYLETMRNLEHLYGRLCRELYTPNNTDLHRFLRNPRDFGFNYDLKTEHILKLHDDVLCGDVLVDDSNQGDNGDEGDVVQSEDVLDSEDEHENEEETLRF